jgi:hypothetical protein
MRRGVHPLFSALVIRFGLFGLLGSALPRAAQAQDRFEIQVYDAETAPPAGFGLETHLNHIVSGTTTRSPDGEDPTNHQTHLTFEPHVGVCSWCELGAYFQTAMDANGYAAWGGFKLRFKARLPRRYVHELIGLALNAEISIVPARYEANVFGSELRPIIDVRWRRLYWSLNPIIDIDLAGAIAGRPQLEPAFKFAVDAVAGALAFGIEYYGAYGPITGFLPAGEQTHRLFGIVDVFHSVSPRLNFALNFGVGYNLAGAGDRLVVKAILGVGI